MQLSFVLPELKREVDYYLPRDHSVPKGLPLLAAALGCRDPSLQCQGSKPFFAGVLTLRSGGRTAIELLH